jgi:predicted outer membrane protein
MREGLLKTREGTVLAKQKASSAEVKSFAEQMIQDHTKANQELEQLAKQKGITVPAALDNEGQAKIDKLSKCIDVADLLLRWPIVRQGP